MNQDYSRSDRGFPVLSPGEEYVDLAAQRLHLQTTNGFPVQQPVNNGFDKLVVSGYRLPPGSTREVDRPVQVFFIPFRQSRRYTLYMGHPIRSPSY